MKISARNILHYFGIPVIKGLMGVEAIDCDIKWKIVHEQFSILAIAANNNGTSRMRYDGKILIGQANDLIFFEPGSTHSIEEITAPGNYSVLWLSNELIAKMASHLGLNVTPHFKAVPSGAQYLNKVLFSLLNQIKSKATFEKIEAQWLYFCYQLFKNGANKKVLIPGTLDQTALKKAYDFILCNADKNISLQDITEICGLSVYHFCRSFKKRFGYTPHEFLMDVRLENARQAIINGRELPAICFSDQSHFIRCFKKKWKVTPGEFQKIFQKERYQIGYN